MATQPKNNEPQCNEKMEVYSRVVGFFRPVNQWNIGKQEEFGYRKTFTLKNLKPVVNAESEFTIHENTCVTAQ